MQLPSSQTLVPLLHRIGLPSGTLGEDGGHAPLVPVRIGLRKIQQLRIIRGQSVSLIEILCSLSLSEVPLYVCKVGDRVEPPNNGQIWDH